MSFTTDVPYCDTSQGNACILRHIQDLLLDKRTVCYQSLKEQLTYYYRLKTKESKTNQYQMIEDTLNEINFLTSEIDRIETMFQSPNEIEKQSLESILDSFTL